MIKWATLNLLKHGCVFLVPTFLEKKKNKPKNHSENDEILMFEVILTNLQFLCH